MDCKAPPGVGGHDDLRALDDYYLCSDQLLLYGGGAGSSCVDEEQSPINLPDPPPQPSSPVPMYYAACNPSGKETPSEAEMASWLCEVFQREPAATMNQSERGNDVVPSNIGDASADGAASGEAECRRGLASNVRRRRSCSGKFAEQRRRNKINDKLRTLQQMVPRCSKVKTDTASTLDEVIKYVKSLKHQLQVMSANGFAVPVVMPPPWMQLPAGDVLGVGGQAPVMFPQYPVFPTVFAFPHHATPPPPPLLASYTRRYPVEPGSGIPAAGSSSLLLEGPRHAPSHSGRGQNDVRAARSM